MVIRLVFLISIIGFTLMAHDTSIYGPVLETTLIKDSLPATATINIGTHLYCAGRNVLATYDLTDPLNPKLVHQLKGIPGGRQMARQGNLLAITARDLGVWFVDISNKNKPKVMHRFDAIELATGISIAGDCMFIALRVYGIQILDIRDPMKPKHVAILRTDEAQTVFAKDNKIFVGDWNSGRVLIADVSNPRKPQKISITQMDGYGDGLDVVGNLCLASTGHHQIRDKSRPMDERFGKGHGLEIIDITNVNQPTVLSTVKFPKFYTIGNDFWTVRICGDKAFAVDTHNGFFKVDIADKKNPKILGHAVFPEITLKDHKTKEPFQVPDCATSLALGDKCVYVATSRSGVFVVPDQDAKYIPQAEQQLKLPPEEPFQDIPGLKRFDVADGHQLRRITLYKDDLAFIACSHGGIRLIKLDPNNTTVLKTWNMACAYDVVASNGRLYAAEGKDGIAIYEITNDLDLKLLKRYKPTRTSNIPQVIHLYKNDTRLLWHGRGGTLFFLDIENLDAIRCVKKHNQRGILYSDLLSDKDIDGKVLCVWGSGGLSWFDLNPKTPVIAKAWWLEKQNAGHLNAPVALGKTFITALRGGTYGIFNASDLGEADEDKRYKVDAGTFNGIGTSNGNIVTLANRRSGNIDTFDFSNPQQAKNIPSRTWNNLQITPDRPVFWKGRIIVPGGHAGLFMEKKPQ